MRLRIIEALSYPRTLLAAVMDSEDCPQNRYFNPAHESCRWCRQGEECRWLNRHDEFSSMSQKSTKTLIDSLMFCIDYVDAQCFHANHFESTCACESCTWVKGARTLVLEYQNAEQTR